MSPTILFIIGRPGSGKTTAADSISLLTNKEHFSVAKINDYDILSQMLQTDLAHTRFLLTEHGGFDVIDFSVLDEALQEIEQVVKVSKQSYNFVTIEFARDNYRKAIGLFSDDFLKDSYFLYLDASVEICLVRIHQRVANPSATGDHPSLSDDKFKEYYGKDDKLYITTNFKSAYNLSDQQVVVIQNEGTKEEFLREIERYFKDILLKAIENN